MTALAPPGLQTVFQQSTIDYVAILPLLIVFGVAIVGVLVEAFVPRDRRHVVQVAIAVLGLLAAFVAVIVAAGHQGLTMGITDGASDRRLFALAIDGPAGRPRPAPVRP